MCSAKVKPIDSATLFVRQMREDEGFRKTVKEIGDTDELWKCLRKNGFYFNACDLVKAMAACMAETEATNALSSEAR